jgi:hypothetical protein
VTNYRLHPTNWRAYRSSDPTLPFALLRLADWAADGGLRAVLTPAAPTSTFTPGDPVCLLQHAPAGPLKLAFGSVRGHLSTGRLDYSVRTEAGAAGAPCFTSDLRLAAMHVARGAEPPHGIAIHTILSGLEKVG